MHDSIGIISCERFSLEITSHHRLIQFPYEKGIFPKTVTFYNLEQPLHPLPQDPI